MSRIFRPVINFLKKEDGPTAVECALMLALVIVICIVAINTGSPAPEAGAEPVVVETVSR